MDGERRNMPKSKRVHMTGRGPVGKTAVVGAKDRATKHVAAEVVTSTDAARLQGFVNDHVKPDATICTDDHKSYIGLPNHQSVRHSVGEYGRGQAHANGVESFWGMLKRGYYGTFHKISPKHLNHSVQEFAGRQNVRESYTVDQMGKFVAGMSGKRLGYRTLIARNELRSRAQA